MTALPPPVFAEIAARFESQRRAFAADRNPDWKTRIERLNRLLALVEQSEDAIVAAVDDDFGHRAAQETRLAELFVVRAGVRHARRRLKRWMRNRAVATDLHFLPGRNRLAAQPLGVVGVVSPWNYPIQLSLGPALAALAAGNRVMIKPSELTPRTSALLEKLAAAHFDPDELSVVNGDAETGKAFVSLSFDHLIFTGSTAVGRQVALAAAANLTPVTLELGGKSPAIFDASCEMAIACRRLAYGKLLNAGQTCIAPDYLLVPKGQARAAADLLAHAMARMYPTLASNRDYTAIVSERHRQRLIALVQEARAAGAEIIEVNPAGETFDAASRKLEPTLVIGAPETTRLMREEIFGPVLPILEYERLEDAVAIVNRGERPLALYWFGRDAARCDRVLRETVSGGVTVNDCMLHLVQEEQPFGGVGASGMGAYHGEWGFRTFSKLKPVFHQARWNAVGLLQPPYGRTFDWLLRALKLIT
ncbi:MAG: coniferyl aldehyde dehydrogenase [Roseiarcus sp.]